VKALLETLKHTAHELKQDIAAYHKASGKPHP
jgi:hypothetical protein